MRKFHVTVSLWNDKYWKEIPLEVEASDIFAAGRLAVSLAKKKKRARQRITQIQVKLHYRGDAI